MQVKTGRKRACVGGWVYVSLLSFALRFFLCAFCMFVGFFFCISLFFLLAYVSLVELSVKKTRRSACDALPSCTTCAH